MDYRYLKNRGWLNEAQAAGMAPPGETREAMLAETLSLPAARFEAAPAPRGGRADAARESAEEDLDWQDAATTVTHAAALPRGLRPAQSRGVALSRRVRGDGLDSTPNLGGAGVFLYTVEEGQRVLMRRPDGTMEVIIGPRRLWRGANTFVPMKHHVAHPGDYLIVRHRDGTQEHLPGPAEMWFDARIHQEILVEEGLQLAAKEAVVVYSAKLGTGTVQRRVVEGPALFIPQPGEWLHTFSWHASQGGSRGVVKVPNGLVFQKLWMMPDQMYHDVSDVRTADDAVLTVRLMIFFELRDINTMLEATHDPIGDFVNAASSDVVDFVARHDLDTFKRHTDQLNELATYKQLTARAVQCGYRINKVVYRGYGAPERLQAMHDQAIEARTKLQLERETERQRQELESSKLENELLRAAKRRAEQALDAQHELELEHLKREAQNKSLQANATLVREQARLDAEAHHAQASQEDLRQREHLAALKDLGVDLTAFLTRGRPDRVIELRGSDNATHLHLQDGAWAPPEASRPSS
jgi:hypothetical protein